MKRQIFSGFWDLCVLVVRRRWGCVYKGGKFKVIKEVIKGVKALVLFDGIVGFCLMGLRMESVTLTTPMGRGQLGKMSGYKSAANYGQVGNVREI